MKKTGLFFVILLVAGAGAYFTFQRPAARRINAAELLPANALFLAEMPDFRRSAGRWKQTALSQLWQEPEVQVFLEKPRSKIPWMIAADAQASRLARIAPHQAFVAIATLDGNTPRWVAGFSFDGSRKAVEEALADPRAQMHKALPTGRDDLVSYGSAEIQTFTDKEEVVAEAFCPGWYFVSNQLDLMRNTLDRFNGKPPQSAAALTTDEVYRKTLAALPAEGDLAVFGRVGVLTDRFTALMSMVQQKGNAQAAADTPKTVAFGLCTRMDGEQFRDTLYFYAPGTVKAGALARSGLPLTKPSTLLYYAASMPEASAADDSPGLETYAQLVPAVAAFTQALMDKGLKFSDKALAFGPELDLAIDWPAGAPIPSPLLAVDLRDRQKAVGFVEALASLGDTPWQKSEADGATIYAAPAVPGLPLPAPAVAVTEKTAVLGLSLEAVTEGLSHQKANAGGLAANPDFQAAEKTVIPANSAFGYIDLKSLVEKAYGLFRPVYSMSMAMDPAAGQTIDAGKLPETATLSKHLGPCIFSQATREDGTLVESTGPLTFDQVMVAALAGAGYSIAPTVEQNMKGQNGPPTGLWPPSIPWPGGNAPAPAAPAAPGTPDPGAASTPPTAAPETAP